MFNYTLILIASIVTIGIMELLKVYLPKDVNPKIKATISLVLSAGAAVGFGFMMKVDMNSLLMSTGATIGLVQCSYDFVLKLLLNLIETIKQRIEEYVISKPLMEKQLELELKNLLDAETPKAESKD